MSKLIDHTADLPLYGDGEPPLTSRDLMSVLRGQPNRLVVLSQDAEGNGFSPLYSLSLGLFDARELRGEVYPTPEQMKAQPELADLFGPLPAGLREVWVLTPAG
ncbi:hypothetical protein OG756_41485 (plasmid) [Streptomyces sp. NBC_01310]|uniref:hypothetical protein n=1 Tax=Streptomyces TaxID=1883 RepID=UPI002253AB26|nr:hypothetical protein [Streptomyces virginiae]MCX5278053.1 hypothetical protein [Streptomyces virginiae]WSJ64492.1 hypothetical protein OG756_41485 [Streptomyces sp. NBC_01310]